MTSSTYTAFRLHQLEADWQEETRRRKAAEASRDQARAEARTWRRTAILTLGLLLETNQEPAVTQTARELRDHAETSE